MRFSFLLFGRRGTIFGLFPFGRIIASIVIVVRVFGPLRFAALLAARGLFLRERHIFIIVLIGRRFTIVYLRRRSPRFTFHLFLHLFAQRHIVLAVRHVAPLRAIIVIGF